MKTEDLSETIYGRASFMDIALNTFNRSEWPIGAGLDRSAFTIQRSEPSSDEEDWPALAVTDNESYVGSCSVTYNQTYVGHLEVHYAPESFGLKGPLICQTDLTLHWKAPDFWGKYFTSLERRNVRSVTNRLWNIHDNMVGKWSCVTGAFAQVDGISGLATKMPAAVDLNGDTAGSTAVTLPDSALDQSFLDGVALHLTDEGASTEDTNGWVTLGPEGPIYPLLIGQDASNKILLNNAELRRDYRSAFEAFGDANPVIARIGASRVIKNFRHIIDLKPPRWAIVPNGSPGVELVPATGTDPHIVSAANASGVDRLVRVPTFIMRKESTFVTKGKGADINPHWKDPSIASVEGARAFHPMVFTEEILRPVNAAPGMKWNAQNYMGEWRFINGNDALIGFDDCANVPPDPLGEQGRHFAQYKHAAKPVAPYYGALVLFNRCSADYNQILCS